MTTADCIFCRIIAGEIPCEKVLETDTVLAFRDIAPKAPVHVLVVPKVHIPNVAAAAALDPAILGDIASAAQLVADAECEGQFRLIFNTGERAGQSVFHVHGHVMNSGALGWDA